jgi:type II secretory pathway pseudopilin PulG
MVLVAIVVVSIAAQVASLPLSRIMRNDKEQELLFRGQAYMQAIESYYRSVPGNPAYPRYLSDLEKDPRFLRKTHIRQLYSEPVEGEWRVLRNGDGGIIGVASSSLKAPLKTDNFPVKLNIFTGAERYADWEFLYLPVQEGLQ